MANLTFLSLAALFSSVELQASDGSVHTPWSMKMASNQPFRRLECYM